jgi:signal transduction histidine kinase
MQISYPAKIRLMLALLTATLLLTALIAQKTYTSRDNLQQSSKLLESNLHHEEKTAFGLLENQSSFNNLKTLEQQGQAAIDFNQKTTVEGRVWVLTYKNGRLAYWSGIKYIPQLEYVKEGISFIESRNSYFEVIRKTQGDFAAVLLIPVKSSYIFRNQYLQNNFAPELIADNNIELASFTDKNVYNVHSIKGPYLFSLKLKQDAISPRLFYFELTFWFLTLVTLCLLVQNICSYLARKGRPVTAVSLLAAFIIGLRFVNLYLNLPDLTNKIDLFNPRFYGSGTWSPDLGDFCINMLMFCWFSVFFFQQRNRVLKRKTANAVSYSLLVISILVLLLAITAFLRTFYGLIINSTISFDVNNALGLSQYSAIGILMLCFGLLTLFMLTEVLLTFSRKFPINWRVQLAIFLSATLLTTIIVAAVWEFTLIYLIWAVITVVRGYSYRFASRKINSGLFISIILLMAIISAVMLSHFQSIKEHQLRESLSRTLEKQDDETADYIFSHVENQLAGDSAVIRSFRDTIHNTDYLKNRFRKLYFDGYLSKYDFNVYEFDDSGNPVSKDKSYTLDAFESMVQFSSFRESRYFYRENASFGLQHYFALIPVNYKGRLLGRVVITLDSKSLQVGNSFPALLVDGDVAPQGDFKNYSYALYSDDNLLIQHGSFTYKLYNDQFRGVLNKYVYKTTQVPESEQKWYKPFSSYSHLIYKPSPGNLIVITREENMIFYDLTALTVFFVIILVFAAAVVIVRWSFIRIKILNLTGSRLRLSFRLNFDRLLYKTRIQFSMVLTVVITLVLVGIVTFVAITAQYRNQQELLIKDKISRITDAFTGPLLYQFLKNNSNEDVQIAFNLLADSYQTDLILYDTHGGVLLSTQPKIYESGIIARQMNAMAFIKLNNLKLADVTNTERLGALSYQSVYAPIRDSGNHVLAYLQLPYFANEADYTDRIGSLLNVMINIYALIFIAIALFAVAIAQQITSPLSFIQNNLGKIIYGKKNEPIRWDRDDEIGALVQEYNKMIAELEVSASKLAQSERESAWREMAKQVAHEIKNPLTPLKLGLQLLEKAWREKDPKFDQKFERFSKSFVEQIESLSSIASEFSAFAKMPDTRIERINLFQMLNQAVIIFKHTDNFTIEYVSPDEPFFINADRDQILRCFNNLLKNAIEATPAGRHGIILIEYIITERNILLTIKDNGNGIPEHMHEKIFEPNFTTKSSGTGLGLAFVKNSIENAGGKVWFETEINVGTTFFFSLPAAV